MNKYILATALLGFAVLVTAGWRQAHPLQPSIAVHGNHGTLFEGTLQECVELISIARDIDIQTSPRTVRIPRPHNALLWFLAAALLSSSLTAAAVRRPFAAAQPCARTTRRGSALLDALGRPGVRAVVYAVAAVLVAVIIRIEQIYFLFF